MRSSLCFCWLMVSVVAFSACGDDSLSSSDGAATGGSTTNQGGNAGAAANAGSAGTSGSAGSSGSSGSGTSSLDGPMTPPTNYEPTLQYPWDPPTPDLVVDALTDDAGLSLTEALQEVRGGGVIRISPALAGQTYLSAAPINIVRSLTLDASQAPGFVIDGGGADAGLRVGKQLNVTLVGLTIRRVRTQQLGGGIFFNQSDTDVRGEVRVVGCTLEDNHGAAAGGIYIRRRINAVIRDSVFRNNRALLGTGDDLGKAGGAISARAEGSLRIERTTFVDNDGPEAGAVYSISQPLLIQHSLFLNNGGEAAHGAVLSDGGSEMKFDGVLVHSNRGHGFGGAVQLYGYKHRGDRVILHRSVFVENSTSERKGGAAYLIGDQLDITSSVFVRNRSLQDAGAIYFPGAGSVLIRNSIFGENVCEQRSGGGFRKDGGDPVQIEDSLFAYNEAGESGGGFWGPPDLQVNVQNTIFSENVRGQFVSASITNGGENVFFPVPANPPATFADSLYADPHFEALNETRGVWWYPMRPGSLATG